MRALVLLLCSSLWGAERWQMQYFFDENKEELHFAAMAFCSPQRGVAVGFVSSSDKVRPAAVVTSNAGKTWMLMEPDETGYALFFLDETAGWMVTDSGIWFTDECGRTWRRIHKQRGLTDVRFVSRERGWAIGANKTVIETSDGGKTWTRVKAAEDLDTNPQRTTFHAMEFLSPQRGIITGKSSRNRESSMPLWLDPHPTQRAERPGLSVTLETHDGGASWMTSKVSMFGRISRVRLRKDGTGLALVEFDDYFQFPSELYQVRPKSEETARVFRRKNFAVTDIQVGEVAYAAGFEPSGTIFRSPVPGKVRIARSVNLTDWIESEIDYRAVATRVVLAPAGDQMWAATDTGMILKRTSK